MLTPKQPDMPSEFSAQSQTQEKDISDKVNVDENREQLDGKQTSAEIHSQKGSKQTTPLRSPKLVKEVLKRMSSHPSGRDPQVREAFSDEEDPDFYVDKEAMKVIDEFERSLTDLNSDIQVQKINRQDSQPNVTDGGPRDQTDNLVEEVLLSERKFEKIAVSESVPYSEKFMGREEIEEARRYMSLTTDQKSKRNKAGRESPAPPKPPRNYDSLPRGFKTSTGDSSYDVVSSGIHPLMNGHSTDSGNRVDHPSSSPQQNYFVVVAIDFGTTYSGYAFSFTQDPDNIHMMRKWEGGDPGVVNQKTPTTLLLDPEERFHSFGYAARDCYHDLEPQEAKKWLYFEKFKMTLHKTENLSRDTIIYAANGKGLSALTVFAHALRYFRKHALQELSDQSATCILNDDVRWVVTVPAIWRQPAKQFMRNAAYEAGIASKENPEQLLIALEPEAASIFCRRLRQHQLVPMMSGPQRLSLPNIKENPDSSLPAVIENAGTRYMVVDCGGGTVDITVHEITDENGNHQRTAQGHRRTLRIGGNRPGIRKNFWLTSSHRFPRAFKINYPRPSPAIFFRPPLQEDEKYYGGKHRQEVQQQRDQVVFPRHAEVGAFWNDEPLPADLRRHPNARGPCSGHLRVLRCHLLPISGWWIRRVSHPPEEHSRMHSLTAQSHHSSRCQSSYSERFIHGTHPPDKLVVKDGVEWCADVFDKFVLADQSVCVGDTVIRRYTPARSGQACSVIHIYCSERDDVNFITDPGVKRCGTLVLDLPDEPKQPQGKREIQTIMIFGDTELKVSAMDVLTGSCAHIPAQPRGPYHRSLLSFPRHRLHVSTFRGRQDARTATMRTSPQFLTIFFAFLCLLTIDAIIVKQENSLFGPYQAGVGHLMYWDLTGSSQLAETAIRLTPDEPYKQGAIWNNYPMMSNDWEYHIQFHIHGKGVHLNGDGIAFWYVKDALHAGPVYGSKDYWSGLGIFIDTFENARRFHINNHRHPYLSAVVNNGSFPYYHNEHGTAGQIGGCHLQARNLEWPAKVAISYISDILTVYVDSQGTDNWAQCFRAVGVHLPTGYHFGVSASTSEYSDNHDVVSVTTLDNIIPDKVWEDRSQLVPNAEFLEIPFAEPKEKEETAAASPSSFTMKLIYFGGAAVVLYTAFSLYKKRKLQKRERQKK
ncbi:Heat shock 70 kDa protein 12A like protein [Argiope bruennichi]|uniref:Heat shock 70 kDa protein 12A like protein n=1 Tax=Argiope bruennichi TaxID=94029 RepID=A0A8T0E9C7_ARGBR|nr:Heat shock 70 kDa protein 12A like protein [Argiope bruennichi]